MILRQTVWIDAPPEEVWVFLDDPEIMKAWNPKLVSVVPNPHRTRCVGREYRAVYSMSGRQTECIARVEKYQPPLRLEIHVRRREDTRGKYVREIYELSAHNGGTQVTQSVDLQSWGIPSWVGLFMKLLHRFGSSVEQPYLERLKNLVEENRPPVKQ